MNRDMMEVYRLVGALNKIHKLKVGSVVRKCASESLDFVRG